MAMTPGTRLGPYEILAKLGEGGMGEVYRARDAKLNRDVAIKVLPETFAGDHDRLSRFTREAQVLASLNHPNIAHAYGIENNALERDVKLRLRDIGEARVELTKIADHPELPSQPSATVAAPPPSRLPWVVAGVAVAVAAAAGWSALGTRPPSTSATMHMRLNLDPAEALLGSDPTEIRIGSRRPSRTVIALSSDGRWLAFTGVQKGTQQLFLRDLGRDAGIAVAGTTGADNPFFSPDDKWIGFWSGGALRKVPVDGGPVSEICKTTRIAGADWSRDGRILFGADGAISVVSADGGAPSMVAKLDTASDDDYLRLPRWIDANQFLYSVLNSRAVRSRLVAQRLDGSEKRVLIDDASDGRLVAGGSHLVFMRNATLMAAPFDLRTASLAGAAHGMVDGVQVSMNAPNGAIEVGAGEFAVSDSGTLVYLPGQIFADSQAVFTWVDRNGQASPLDEMDRRSYSAPRLSADNLRAVTFTIGNERAIWIHDFQRRSTRKVRFDGLTGRVIWTPDGRSIVFGGQTEKDRGLYRMPADGSGSAEHLPGGVRGPSPSGWSRDGTELVYVELVREADGGNGSYDIFGVTLATGKIRAMVQTKSAETHPAVSPDGRWLAYVSNETGRNEVVVQPYDGGGRVDISVGGGTGPRWTHDGKSLIYSKQIPDPKNNDRARFELWEVPLTIGATLQAGTPRKFAELAQEDFGTATPTANYDVAIDGRILGTTRHLVTPPPPAILNVITNWFDELRAKVSK